MEFIFKRFDELTRQELYEILRSRSEIFSIEQGIKYQDMDGLDFDALHCFLWESERAVAYLRVLLSDERVKIGRVLSIRHGEGLGGLLMKLSIPKIRELFPKRLIFLHSQIHAVGFYKKLGFSTASEGFLEAGIEHVEMLLDKD